jgi:nickel-dependent lactate racemase
LNGPKPPYGGKVRVHDSRDESQLEWKGCTKRGTELKFNKAVFDNDGIIVISSVEPHYFAGFTGGRKFLLPALAGHRSIELNHSLALDNRSMILRLEGNPVHEDLMEALGIFDRNDDIFSIQLVLNRDHRVSFARSGHIISSFDAAVEHAKEVYVVPVESKADIIIAVATPPMDLDLYQSQKAIESVRLALNDQGIVILVSPCRDGIGIRDFYDLLASGGNVFDKIKQEYRLGFHKAAKFAELLGKSKIFAVTELQSEILRAISISPFKNIQDAVDEATRLKGNNSRILVVKDACLTVPVPKGLNVQAT